MTTACNSIITSNNLYQKRNLQTPLRVCARRTDCQPDVTYAGKYRRSITHRCNITIIIIIITIMLYRIGFDPLIVIKYNIYIAHVPIGVIICIVIYGIAIFPRQRRMTRIYRHVRSA